MPGRSDLVEDFQSVFCAEVEVQKYGVYMILIEFLECLFPAIGRKSVVPHRFQSHGGGFLNVGLVVYNQNFHSVL